MVPQPISVGTTGTLRISASSTSRSEASALMMPPPATISGRSADDQHVDRLRGLGSRCRRLVDGQRLIRLRVEIDLGQLDVDGQIDQHRPGPPRPHQVERLRESAWNLTGFEHRHRHLGDGCGDGGDVDGLEVLFVESGHWRLAGDRKDRNGIR